MFSGIIYLPAEAKERHLLDVVVNDASPVEEVDAREKEMEPFASFGLFDLYWDECGKVGPGNRQSTTCAQKTRTPANVHGDHGVGRGHDKRMERNNRGVWVVLECANNLHLVPAAHKKPLSLEHLI